MTRINNPLESAMLPLFYLMPKILGRLDLLVADELGCMPIGTQKAGTNKPCDRRVEKCLATMASLS